MNIIKKVVAIGDVVTALAVAVLPLASFAQDYVVSPSYIPTSTMSTANANQVCTSLPDSVASQTSFCSFSTVTIPSIADNAIMIAVNSSTSVTITWSTSVPTTSVLWYSPDPTNPTATVEYSNTGQGYATFHSINISGIDLVNRHLFTVGGIVQGNGVTVSSGEQWL